MSFGEGVFWPAFKGAGMLEVVELLPESGDSVTFDAGFERPDQIVLDGVAHTTGYQIEYQATDVTLQRGNRVRIAGQAYKVTEPPRATGGGEFFIAYLDKVGP